MNIGFKQKRIQDVEFGSVVFIEDTTEVTTESKLDKLYLTLDESSLLSEKDQTKYADDILVADLKAGCVHRVPFDTMVTPVDARLIVDGDEF